MSGKFKKSRNKPAQKVNKQKRSKLVWIMLVIVLLTVAVIAAVLAIANRQTLSAQTIPTAVSEEESELVQEPARVDALNEVSINLNMQLEITDIGSYAGVYMEDGSDEFVSNVLMMVVKNITEETIQYAEIEIETGKETAKFALTTLPAGESVVILEQNRMEYSKNVSYADCPMKLNNVAATPEPLTLHDDKLRIQTMDGIINVTNISGEDIFEDIFIYYKNSAADLYYGGITYRIKLQGGLKVDEIKQISATHFNQDASSIMFVSFGA